MWTFNNFNYFIRQNLKKIVGKYYLNIKIVVILSKFPTRRNSLLSKFPIKKNKNLKFLMNFYWIKNNEL